MNSAHQTPIDLQAAARQVMQERGFHPDFSPAAQQQLAQIQAHPPQIVAQNGARDLRDLLWSSIDNDTSKDLDQIEAAQSLPDGTVKILIAIADVDAFVNKHTPIDSHAADQTTTIYTGIRNFSMLPEALSTGITSLLENQDRLSLVIEFVVGDGEAKASDIYRALVRNKAQLTYNAVGNWLEGTTPAPPKVAASPELQKQLQLQNQAAQALRKERFRRGALNIDTIEVRPILMNEKVVDIARQEKNPATDLIEDFMIAANGVVARMAESKKISSIRRIVKVPERWDRIVALAAETGDKLPGDPNSKALNDYLVKRRAVDPDHFADLSLTVIKLMGPGEYVLERPGDPEQGHFGLAVQDYTHSTAPNRRFADLVTQRIIKAVLDHTGAPYSDAELDSIANHCTLKENAARKVERDMSKRIAAVAMSNRIGQVFDAVVTGSTPKGTFVRVLQPHVEGLLAQGAQGADVGDRLRAKLIRTDPQHGFIDFARV